MPYYSTSVPDTASEVFDGEVVIAHYGSGLYFSISEGGTPIWLGLRAQLSVAEVVDWLVERYAAAADAIPTQVAAFVAQLCEAGLLIETAAPEQPGAVPAVTLDAWREPGLDRFDDLQELLLLDPVHDVTEAGWPNRPDDQK